MQEGKRISNGEFNGEAMGRQWGGRAVKRLFQPSFFHPMQTKNQQPHFCKLLIFRAENGTRTRDLNLGKVALYQLSYFRMACFVIANAKVVKKSESPNFSILFCKFFTICPFSFCRYLKTRRRSSSGSKLFSWGSPAGSPNGIWAISRHCPGSPQCSRTSLSISGL